MKLVDANQLVSILAVSNRQQVYELARRGLIPSIRIGRKLRFDLDKLSEWAERGGTPITEIRKAQTQGESLAASA